MKNLLWGCVLAGVCCVANAAERRTWCNPMPLPDYPVGYECRGVKNGSFAGPFWLTETTKQFRELADSSLLYEKGTWYVFPSVDVCWRSKDGAEWEHIPLGLSGAEGGKDLLGYAPTVIKHRGKIYLMGSFANLFVADKPEGPYTLLGKMENPWGWDQGEKAPGIWDPMLFSDDDDKLYLYWGCSPEGGIWGVELDGENPLRQIGGAKKLIAFDPETQPWEIAPGKDSLQGFVEGGWMVKVNGKYILTYSAGGTENYRYATGQAVSDDPLTGFKKAEVNPFLQSLYGPITGTGHGSVVKGPEGKYYASYSIRVAGAHWFERFIGFDIVEVGEDGAFRKTRPTDTPQWLPGCGEGATGWEAIPIKAKWGSPEQTMSDGIFATHCAVKEHTFEFGDVYRVMAYRMIWKDVGLDIERGVKAGPIQYLLEYKTKAGTWETLVDATGNDRDLLIDYRETPEVYAKAIRLTVTGAPERITPAVAEFTPFGMKALKIVPAPVKCEERGGWTANGEIKFVEDKSIATEGYRLSVTRDGITVAASDEAGKFYAQETLKQIARRCGGTPPYQTWPCVEIEDQPRYKWRGVHFDDCRHFFGKEVVMRTLDQMAMHKLNRFHWHLTEDQGWRLEIPGYPELVKYGAVRSSSVKHGARAGFRSSDAEKAAASNHEKYGPYYYTEADVKEILAYAAARHIQVVPEIELPGHFQAVLAAYPEFACFPDEKCRDPLCVWGISRNVMCVGNEKAVKFLEDVLDYVCRLFPGDVVHIGGDECPQEKWKECPKCQALIKKEKLGDEKGLQPYITRHFVKFLEKRGKRSLGWDEYLLGDVPASAMGMNWRTADGHGAGHELMGAAKAAAAGHDMVMTPTEYCYLDYAQGLAEDPYQYIGGAVTLEKSYALDPCAGVPEEARKHIIGGQGNNWSEYTWNRYDLEWKMWPRMCALAEVFWLGEKKPGYGDFKWRMETHRKRLLKAGVNAAPVK